MVANGFDTVSFAIAVGTLNCQLIDEMKFATNKATSTLSWENFALRISQLNNDVISSLIFSGTTIFDSQSDRTLVVVLPHSNAN